MRAGACPLDVELAGFYAQAPGQVQQRADLPAWYDARRSATAAQHFSLVSRAGQPAGGSSSTCANGVITTTATVDRPDGHVTGLRTTCYTDRARPDTSPWCAWS